mmetsp:Transcript_18888/g.31231  ORF Transcript_18888/g.31231 Transcript_18888/m.31231 type:complete len:606 (+) Transcript_18888:121-1938(+)|eukprot:CAMPEP_0119003580 /NCGR_PEP_ID=MMETSP1176-20130426/645_1 /TAXON_ID=265551 /ORGANISM="Synedropsis recta cf, Strain CCMP1620" /LENGTH=605 /DNA_ID=CAMNT_0006955195 /DNA_START=121 /DNA_END=1938 /DNA_ORIENTATION=-
MNGLLNAKVLSEAEKRLAGLLFEETQQVLSTFEMNQIASLSYEDETCEQIFDMLEEVMAHPMKSSVLAVQKSLFVAKHLLIYGSEKCVNSCWGLSSHVEELCHFNTVILAQKQQGIGSWWQSVKGGGVDKGFPVREASQKLHVILSDAPHIQQLRHDNADPNSLVPVGSTEKVAFVSDEVRHYMLKKRMDEHALLHTRSNLVKSVGGFGSGYNSKDGQTVVGAAHSMEEMMKRAEKEKKKFTETGPVHYKPKPPKPVAAPKPPPPPAGPIDLLDFTASAPAAPEPQVDLLGFGGAAPAPPTIDIFAPAPPAPAAATNGDLLGGDLLGGGLLGGATVATEPVKDTADLLSLMAVSVPATTTEVNLMNRAAIDGDSNGLLSMNGLTGDGLLASGGLGGMLSTTEDPTAAKSSVMTSNLDRFAALDALSPPAPVMTKLSGIEAENRILSFTGSVPTLSNEGPPPLPTEAPPPLPPTNVDAGGDFMGGTSAMGGGSPMGGGGMGADAMGGMPTMGGAPMGSMQSFGMAPPVEAPPLPTEAPPFYPSPVTPVAMVYDTEPGTTMGVAAKYGGGTSVDDDDDGFVMGGSSGAGLEPMGAMPSAPPPPPPPS